MLCFAGCSYVPWHPFGTPLTSEKKAEEKVDKSERQLMFAAQEAVHKFNFAIDLAKAGNLRAIDVAEEQGRYAQAALDQALGTPKIGDDQKWHDLVARLVSENAEVREKAEKENVKSNSKIADLSADLESMRKKLTTAENKALEYAGEKEKIADHFLKICWVLGGLAFVWVLSQLLRVAANFVPALAPFSAIANGVVAPAMHYELQKAKRGLQQVGAAMGTVRAELGPELSKKVRDIFNAKLDEHHQDAVGDAADATVGSLSK